MKSLKGCALVQVAFAHCTPSSPLPMPVVTAATATWTDGAFQIAISTFTDVREHDQHIHRGAVSGSCMQIFIMHALLLCIQTCTATHCMYGIHQHGDGHHPLRGSNSDIPLKWYDTVYTLPTPSTTRGWLQYSTCPVSHVHFSNALVAS